MDHHASVRTAAYVLGIAVLLIVLGLVAGISTGVLPWRESYADEPWPTNHTQAVTPLPTGNPEGQGQLVTTATPTPTPTPTPEATPEPTPTPTPVPTPEVTLEEELPTYTITVTFSRGGSAIPYGNNTVVQNGSMSVVAVPDEGYAVGKMIIDGESYTGIDRYDFTDVCVNHSVHIVFERSAIFPEQGRPSVSEEGQPPAQ